MLDDDDKVLHVLRYDLSDGHLVEDVDNGSFMWYDDALEKVNELVAYIESLEHELVNYKTFFTLNSK